MSRNPSTQREVDLMIGIDEDGDRALFAQHPDGDIDEWLCGSVENPRSCYSTYAAELNMLCYGKATTRIDLVVECEDGEKAHVYKDVDWTGWRTTGVKTPLSWSKFLDLFLYHGVRYYLR